MGPFQEPPTGQPYGTADCKTTNNPNDKPDAILIARKIPAHGKMTFECFRSQLERRLQIDFERLGLIHQIKLKLQAADFFAHLTIVFIRPSDIVICIDVLDDIRIA